MPDNVPVEPYRDILGRYGLDVALTGEDDAGLWAAALLRHFPDPGDPDAPVSGMTFTVGLAHEEGADPARSRHGLYEIEAWRFERAGRDRLRALPVRDEADDPRAPRPGEDPFGHARYPLLYLDVQRPSAGREGALVHAGRQAAPLAGSGATRRWTRDAGGAWGEGEETILAWIS